MEFITEALANADWQFNNYIDEPSKILDYHIDNECGCIYQGCEIYAGHIQEHPKDIYVFRVASKEPIIGRVDWLNRTIVPI